MTSPGPAPTPPPNPPSGPSPTGPAGPGPSGPAGPSPQPTGPGKNLPSMTREQLRAWARGHAERAPRIPADHPVREELRAYLQPNAAGGPGTQPGQPNPPPPPPPPLRRSA